MNIIISVTSIPNRFNNELIQVLKHIRHITDLMIVVSIPISYRKAWTYTEEDLQELRKLDSVIINIVDEDWGPATKLLGGIEYIKKHNLDIDGIITIDDDILFSQPDKIINGLIETAKTRPDEIITSGGLKAWNPPYESGNGLDGVQNQYCHAVAGFMGVFYPKSFFTSPVLFSLFDEVGPDFYSEDDAYFGACAQRQNTKIWSTPHNSSFKSISQFSGVQVGYNMLRKQRDNMIWKHILDNHFIDPNK
jgi:hypothetical protein